MRFSLYAQNKPCCVKETPMTGIEMFACHPLSFPLRFSSLQSDLEGGEGGERQHWHFSFSFSFFQIQKSKSTSYTIKEAANVLHHFSWASFSFFHKDPYLGKVYSFQKQAPTPHTLAFSCAISSQEMMTPWELVWGLRTLGDFPPCTQNNLRFLHKQKQNMKGLPQNPLLMSWLSRHMSGLMRTDILDMLREAWKSHPQSYCHFITVNAITLNWYFWTGCWRWLQPCWPSSQWTRCFRSLVGPFLSQEHSFSPVSFQT